MSGALGKMEASHAWEMLPEEMAVEVKLAIAIDLVSGGVELARAIWSADIGAHGRPGMAARRRAIRERARIWREAGDGLQADRLERLSSLLFGPGWLNAYARTVADRRRDVLARAVKGTKTT